MKTIHTHVQHAVTLSVQQAAGLDLLSLPLHLSLEADGALSVAHDVGALVPLVAQAHASGQAIKCLLTGPLSLLWDASGQSEPTPALLDTVLAGYGQLLSRLRTAGVDWAVLDEPLLGSPLAPAWRDTFERAYWQLNQAGLPLILGSGNRPLRDHLGLACRLPVAGLQVDTMSAAHELAAIADWLPCHKLLALGVGPASPAALLEPLLARRRGPVWLAPALPLSQALGPALDALQALSTSLRNPLRHAA